MNETNRTAIILFAALWIVLMAVVIFIAWAAPEDAVDRLGDAVEYMEAHRDEDAARLILTLGSLVLVVLSLLLVIVELAPEEESREIRVEQAGATTIVPAEPLRMRLEEALMAMPKVTAARARVFSQDKGVGMKLDLTVTPDTNIAVVTQEASRVVVETLQADLGLPVPTPPTVRILFGPPKLEPEPEASSIAQPPSQEPPSQAPSSPQTTGWTPPPAEPPPPTPPSPSAWTPPAAQPPSSSPPEPPAEGLPQDDPPQG